MIKLSRREYNEVLIGILKFFDELCRKNGIKYSLIAGSMIGAVREKGIIPWDDDIDVILMPEQYKKLVVALKNNKNKRYKALIPLETPGYYMPFIKIVDLKTHLVEYGIKQKDDSGVFIDVFRYGYFNSRNAKSSFRLIKFYRHVLSGVIDEKKKNDSLKNIIKNIRRVIFSNLFSYEMIIKKYDRIFNNKKDDYVMINFPLYGPSRDLQSAHDTEEYIDCDFDGIKAMIFKNYDSILKKTFGDYMTPPPKKDRVAPHQMEAYWKG